MAQGPSILDQNWNNSAHRYMTKFEPSSLSAGLTLSRMTRVGKAKSVLEVGCGAGLLTLHWLKNLPSGSKYTSIDLSEAMIKSAQQRKEEQKHQLNNVENEFRVADAHDLSFIPDESVDAYIAPMVYCHISDPSKAFNEAKRVLRNGGRIGVSMGTPLNNTLHSFWKNCMTKLNGEGSHHQHGEHGHGQGHSHGHGQGHGHGHGHGEHGHGHGQQSHNPHFAIKGKEHLVQLVQEAGFEVDYCWVEETAFDVLDENDAVELTQNPGMHEMYQNLSEEQKPKFIEILKAEFAEWKKSQTPLRFTALCLTAKKPEKPESQL